MRNFKGLHSPISLKISLPYRRKLSNPNGLNSKYLISKIPFQLNQFTSSKISLGHKSLRKNYRNSELFPLFHKDISIQQRDNLENRKSRTENMDLNLEERFSITRNTKKLSPLNFTFHSILMKLPDKENDKDKSLILKRILDLKRKDRRNKLFTPLFSKLFRKKVSPLFLEINYKNSINELFNIKFTMKSNRSLISHYEQIKYFNNSTSLISRLESFPFHSKKTLTDNILLSKNK